MIVKRKYLTFKQLLNDDKSKNLYEEVCKKSLTEHEYSFVHREEFLNQRIIDKTMDWGLPGGFIIGLEEGLKELDVKYPYNTDYDLIDINNLDIIFKSYDELVLSLNHLEGSYKDLVYVMKLEEKDGKFSLKEDA